MANPVLVRDSFVLGKWYGFVPADKSGRMWSRFDFTVPDQNMTTYSKYFALGQICFGPIYSGQEISPRRFTATTVSIVSSDVSEKQIVVATDLTATFTYGRLIQVSGTVDNDGIYTVVSSAYSAPNTTITLYSLGGTDGGAAGSIIPGDANWSERPGYWLANTSSVDWTGRYTTADNGFATVKIPAGHNYIKIIADVFTGANPGDTMQLGWVAAMNTAVSFTWAAASKAGLDITEQSLSGTARITEYTVATNAVSSSDRYLRIWRKGDGANRAVRILGVRSWNTSVVGDPSTAVDGIAVGHNMIDTIANCTTGCLMGWRDADKMAVLTNIEKAHSWAISNGPHGGSRKFTGDGQHITADADSYEYEYAGGTFTNGPMILLGDSITDMGAVYDATANPLGIVHTDATIHIRSVGLPKWGAGNPPQITWSFDLDSSGLSTNIQLLAVDAVDFDTSEYALMFPLKSGLSAYFKNPLSNTKYDFAAAGNSTIEGANSIDVYVPAHSVMVRCSMVGSAYGAFFLASADKAYLVLWPGGWGTAKPGTPYEMGAAGMCAFGGRYEVRHGREYRSNSIAAVPLNSLAGPADVLVS